FFFFQAEDGIRDRNVTGVQTCALPILTLNSPSVHFCSTYTATDERTKACGSCIINIMSMRLEKLRQADLNLLITFAAIAEEKSRSEERRVGKECRSQWGMERGIKKKIM